MMIKFFLLCVYLSLWHISFGSEQNTVAVLAGSYVAIPPFHLGGNFTLEGWVLFRDRAPGTIFDFSDDHDRNIIRLEVDVEERMRLLVVSEHGEQASIRTSAVIPIGLWLYFAAVYEQGMAWIQWDGKIRASGMLGLSANKERLHNLVGRRASMFAPTFLNGLLDSVRIWSIRRSDKELSENSLKNVSPGDRLGLEVEYRFDEIGELHTRDFSGHSRDGEVFCAQGTSCFAQFRGKKLGCGDGRRSQLAQFQEQCDDGNADDGDGCSRSCTLEPGWICNPGVPGGIDSCVQGTVHEAEGFEDSTVNDWVSWEGSGVRAQQGAWEVVSRARNDGVYGLRLFQPASVIIPLDTDVPMPSMWFKAEHGVHATNNRVSKWEDALGIDSFVTTSEPGPVLKASETHEFSFLRFSNDGTGMKLANGTKFEKEHTLFAFVRYWKPEEVNSYFLCSDGGKVSLGNITIMEEKTIAVLSQECFGLVGKKVGWRVKGTTYDGIEMANVGQWYLATGCVTSEGSKMFVDGTLTLNLPSQRPTPSWSMAIGTATNFGKHSGGFHDVSEIMYFDRPLSLEQRMLVEDYLCYKFSHSSCNTLERLSHLFRSSASQYVTWGHKRVHGNLSTGSMLKWVMNIQQSPSKFAIPLLFVALEETGEKSESSVPHPLDCSHPMLCGARRFYSICYNGGNAFIHCDETVDLSLFSWHKQGLLIAQKFSRKYPEDNLPLSLRVIFGSLSSDEPSEVWVDDFQHVETASDGQCPAISVEVKGLNSYRQQIFDSDPAVYIPFDEESLEDVGRGLHSSSLLPANTTAIGAPQFQSGIISGGNILLNIPQEAVVIPFSEKIDRQLGWGAQFWLRVLDPLTSNVSLLHDFDSSSWSLDIALLQDYKLGVKYCTDLGISHFISTDTITPPSTVHVGLSYIAYHGVLKIWINGSESASLIGGPTRNTGSPCALQNDLVIGGEGPSIVGDMDSVNISVDEFSWHRSSFRQGYIPSLFAYSALDDISSSNGGTVIAADATFTHDGEGLAIWAFNEESLDLEESILVNISDVTTAEAELQQLSNFMHNLSPGAVVAGVYSGEKAEGPRTLLFEDFDGANPNYFSVINQVYHSNSVKHYRHQDYYSIPDLEAPTWEDAANACRERGLALCHTKDYCDLEHKSKSPVKRVLWGQVEGEGWMPVGEEQGQYVALGKAYDYRLCRTYAELPEEERGNETIPPWGSSGLRDTKFLCCSTVDDLYPWKILRQHFPGGSIRNYNSNNGWSFIPDGVKSKSRYEALSPDGDHYHCSCGTLGQVLLYEGVNSLTWTNYRVSLDIYSYYRGHGVMLRYMDSRNFYLVSMDYNHECLKLLKHQNGTCSKVGELPEFETSRSWSYFQFDLDGPNIRVFRNGELVLDVVDENPISSGTVALWTGGGHNNQFRNIHVSTSMPWTISQWARLNRLLETVNAPRFPTLLPERGHRVGQVYGFIGRLLNETKGSVPIRAHGAIPSVSSHIGTGVIQLSSFASCRFQHGIIPENSERGASLPLPVTPFPGVDAHDFHIELGDDSHIFEVMKNTGEILVYRNAINFEVQKNYRLVVSGGKKPFDSGWLYMRSMDPINCFKEIPLPATFHKVAPERLFLRGYVRVADGPNQGFLFSTIGASILTTEDSKHSNYYGGTIMGYSHQSVRLWAPYHSDIKRGFMVKLGMGSGAVYDKKFAWVREQNTQMSHTAEVRVQAWEMSAPDFDSGWFTMEVGTFHRTYKRIPHHLGKNPSLTRVLVQSWEGPNSGFIFEARGQSQATYQQKNVYGGIRYSTTATHFEVFAPWQTIHTDVYSVLVGEGWGNGEFGQKSKVARVRALAWVDRPPSFGNEWGSIQFHYASKGYHEQQLTSNPKGREEIVDPLLSSLQLTGSQQPEVVVMKASSSGSENSRHYILSAMGQSTRRYGRTEGIVGAFRGTEIRYWSVSGDPTNNYRSPNHYPISTKRSYAHNIGSEESTIAFVRAEAWRYNPYAMRDLFVYNIDVVDTKEPPTILDLQVVVSEPVGGRNITGNHVTAVAAKDDDDGDILTYHIEGGNFDSAFGISRETGEIFVNNQAALDFELRPEFHLTVSVSDGTFFAVAIISISIADVNDPCEIFPAEFTVEENLPQYALVGFPVQAFDPDFDQSLIFSIIGGNDNNTFSINSCSGQLRVSNPVLNFEVKRVYHLEVMVMDDGLVPTNDTAIITIHLQDVNDPPVVHSQDLFVRENIKSGELGAILPVFDEDNDPLTVTLSGDPEGYFEIRTFMADPGMNRTQYGLFMSERVVDIGDGSGRNQEGEREPNMAEGALVVNFEDTGRALNYFTLFIEASDGSDAPYEERSAAAAIRVYIRNENDKPKGKLQQTIFITENSPANQGLGQPIQFEDEDIISAPDIERHTFELLSGEDAVDFPFKINPAGSFVLLPGSSLDFEDCAIYNTTVNITDVEGSQLVVEVEIQILDENEPPYLANQTLSVPENLPAGSVLGSLEVIDEDFDESFSFTITSGDPYNLFVVLENGNLTIARAELDYETTDTYELHIKVVDSAEQSAEAIVWIEVLDQNDPPSFSNCPSIASSPTVWRRVPAHSAIQGVVPAPDDVDGINTFQLDLVDGIANVQDCEVACGEVESCEAYTYFSAKHPSLTWKGTCTGRTNFVRTEIPIDTGSPDGVVSGFRVRACQHEVVPETTEAGTPIGPVFITSDFENDPTNVTLHDPAGFFSLIQSEEGYRVVLEEEMLDFEGPRTIFFLELTATDAGLASSTRILAVEVQDVNEPPVIQPRPIYIREEEEEGKSIGLPITVLDDDVLNGQLLYFEIEGSNHGFFDIDHSSGQLKVIQTVHTDISLFLLNISVTDGEYRDFAEVTIHVSNINFYPVLENLDIVREVQENASVGVVLEPALTVSDRDESDTHLFTLFASYPDLPTDSTFSIDPLRGEIRIASTKYLNFECDRFEPLPDCPLPYREFTLLVGVSDSGQGNLTTYGNVTVRVTNIYESPLVPESLHLEIFEMARPGALISYSPLLSDPSSQHNYDFYDDDRDSLSYHIEDFISPNFSLNVTANSALFSELFTPSSIVSQHHSLNTFPESQVPIFHLETGVLDHETEPTVNFTLHLSDGKHAMSIPVILDIVNVPEPPVVESRQWSFIVPENSPPGTLVGTVHAVDPDNDNLVYILQSVTAYRFDGMPTHEAADPTTGQFVKTFALGVDTGQLVLRSPTQGGASVLDFEEFESYSLQIEIRDRPVSDPSGLSVTVFVDVTVTDLNDMTVTKIIVSTPTKRLATTGGELVSVIGTNFGPKWPSSTNVTVEYGCDPIMPENSCSYQAADCYVAAPNTRIDCVSVQGIGANQLWRVTVGDQQQVTDPIRDSSDFPQVTSYEPPRVQNIVSPILATAGGDTVLIIGHHFGPSGSQVSAFYGNYALRDSMCSVEDHTKIYCITVEGIGNNHWWIVEVGGQRSFTRSEWESKASTTGTVTASIELTTSYAPPTILHLFPGGNTALTELRTAGGDVVYVHGTNYGPLYDSESNPSHGTAAVLVTNGIYQSKIQCVVSVAHSELECVTPPGVGREYRLRVAIGGQLSEHPSNQTVSYRTPSLERVSGEGAEGSPTEGGARVLLSGSSFGPGLLVDASVGISQLHGSLGAPDSITAVALKYLNPVNVVTYGRQDKDEWYEARSCSVIAFDSVVECETGPGTGYNHSWMIVIGDQASSIVDAGTSYAAPVVTHFSGLSSNGVQTEGGEFLYIHGFNFGNDASKIERVSYDNGIDHFNATDIDLVENHRVIKIRTAEGAGARLRVSVVIDGLRSGLPRSTYRIPFINTVRGDPEGGFSTRGGEQLVIRGEDFGGPEYLDFVVMGQNNDYQLSFCTTSVPHHEIRCTIPPGVGSDHPLFLSVEGQYSVPAPMTLSYAAPTLLFLFAPENQMMDIQTIPTPGTKLILAGEHLGRVEDGLQIFAATQILTKNMVPQEFADVTCSSLPYIPYSPNMYCFQIAIPEGDGEMRGVTATVGGRWTETLHFSYAPPAINNLLATQDVESGGVNLFITLRGANFGTQGNVWVAIGNVTSAEAIKDGTIPPGNLNLTEYYLEIGDVDQWGPVYSVPCVIDKDDVPELARSPVELFYGHNMIRCYLKGVQGEAIARGSVVVEVGMDSVLSPVVPLKQLGPRIVASSPTDSPTSGGRTLTIAGDFFGSLETFRTTMNGFQIRVGGRDCPIVSFVELRDNDNYSEGGCDEFEECLPRQQQKARVSCTIPEGEGVKQRIIVYRLEDYSIEEEFYVDYHPPEVECIMMGEKCIRHAEGWATEGGEVVTVKGSNFGLSPHVLVNGNARPATVLLKTKEREKHTMLQFVTAPGGGALHQLTILVAGQHAGGVLLSYHPPAVDEDLCDPFPLVLQTTGGEIMTLRGENFGPYDANQSAVLLQGRRLEIVEGAWSHDEIRVFTPRGQGSNLELTIAAFGQATTTNISYYKPQLDDGFPLNGPTSAMSHDGRIITVALFGKHFGTHPVVVFGGIEIPWQEDHVAGRVTDYDEETHQILYFEIPEGQGQVSVRVKAGNQESSPLLFEYHEPEFLALSPTSSRTSGCIAYEELSTWYSRLDRLDDMGVSSPHAFQRLCCQPITFDLYGENFGTEIPQVRFELPEAPPVVVSQLCSELDGIENVGSEMCVVPFGCIASYSHGHIKIRVPPGHGRDVPITVMQPLLVDQIFQIGQYIYTEPLNMSYGAPEVTTTNPRPYNADGDYLYFEGYNLGESLSAQGFSTPIRIEVDGVECNNAMVEKDTDVYSPVFDGLPFISCSMPKHRAGFHNFTVEAALQTSIFSDISRLLWAECPSGTYGKAGEFCIECPVGANCTEGGEADPPSLPSFFREAIGPAVDPQYQRRCPEQRQHREQCPFYAACVPPYACVGFNECAEGYEGLRCSECLKGKYYRVAGDCVPCPQNPEILLISFVLGVVVVCAIAYTLDKKKVNIGIFSIGVDYFQVLAIFASAKVPWPKFLEEFFRLLSAFNLNIDISAPECMWPNLDFRVKFFGTQLLPFGVLVILLFTLFLTYSFDRCIKGQKVKFAEHWPTVVSVSITMLYFMYLLLCRSVLDVFNCNPTTPDQGATYMESTVIPCYEGVHMETIPFAAGFLLLYAVGFPLLSVYLVFKHRVTIAKDQLLRCVNAEVTPSALTEGTYLLRRKYRRLYYLFRPDRYYWIVVIMGRKFLLSFTALMFRGNAAFQLALVVLLMFASFVVQVRNEPFLSLLDRPKELERHEELRKDPRSMHSLAHGPLATYRSERRRRKSFRFLAKGKPMPKIKAAAPVLSATLQRAVNYNTIEATLLFSAVLVALSGIMFQTAEFNLEDASQEATLISVLITIIIIASIVYFAIVLIIDVMASISPRCVETALQRATCTALRERRLLKKRGFKHDATKAFSYNNPLVLAATKSALSNGEEEGKQMQVQTNHMFASLAKVPSTSLASADMPDTPPDPLLYQLYVENYLKMEKEVAQLVQDKRDRLTQRTLKRFNAQ